MTGEGLGKAEAKASGLGKTLTKFALAGGAALALVGYESIKMATKFDQSMEMLATQAGVPQGKIAGLKSGVLALASQVGFSPDSLAESLFHVASNMESMGGKMGSAANELNVVKVAAEGARVGNADLVDVTNALTSAVASGIPGVKNYSQAMGMLNAIVGSGDMHMQDLADAFSTGLLPVMKQYGLSLKDVGAALATFGDLNIRGQKAATDLRMAVMAMTAPTAAGAKDFKSMGMSVQQLAEDIRTGGLMKGLEDLKAHYAAVGVTGTKVGESLTVDFGKKAGVGLAVLLGNMERLQSKYPAIQAGADQFGNAWQQTLQQTSTVFAQLSGFFDALMISIGEKLLPVVKSFGQFILNNKTAVEIFLGVAAALIGILGTYIGVVKVVILVTKLWDVAQKLLNGTMKLNPIGLIITAAIILIPLLIELYKHSELFRQILHDVGEAAKVTFDWLLHAVEETFNWIRGHWPLLLLIFTGPIGIAIGIILALFPRLYHGVESVMDDIRHAIASVWDDVRNDAAHLIDDIVNFFEGLANKVIGFIDMIKNAINSIPGASMIGLAHGGIVGAAAGGPRSGWTTVGEMGPELVRLPLGSQVYSNAQSQGMLGGGGGGGGTYTVQLEFAPGAGDQLVRGIREYIRIRGGNVQQVLGQGAG